MGIPATLSSVPATTPYIQYVATSGQTVFPYPFVITQDSDLVVVDNGTTLGTDAGYTVSGVGNPTGGNVTLNTGATAGDIITLYRDIPIERLTQFAQNGGFSSTAFNAEFNNIYLLLQQLESSIGQCLQVPNTNNPAPTVSLTPANYANKYLAFDANGNPTPAELTTSGSVTSALIAGLLEAYTSAPVLPPNVRTAAEISAAVVPTNYAYPPPDLRRYGQDGTSAADTAALTSALAVLNGSGVITLPVNYAGTNPASLPAGITVIDYRINGTFPVEADQLGGGRWISVGGEPIGALAGISCTQWMTSPSTTTSAVLGTNKMTGNLSAAGGALASGTFEANTYGALTGIAGNIFQAVNGQVSIESTGQTLPLAVGVEGGGGIDRPAATTNITTWASVQGDAVVNVSTAGATITNAYGGRFIQSAAPGITNNNFAISCEGDLMFGLGDSIRIENGSGLATTAITFAQNNLLTIPPNVSLTVGGGFSVNGAPLAAQPTGYGTPTGGAHQGSFAAGSISLANLAAAVAQLIVDLKAYGLLAA